jgi:hypothetical protein
MSNQIDQTEFYEIMDKLWMHCDESQFTYYCKAHGEQMGCYYCEFDYTKPCDCDE